MTILVASLTGLAGGAPFTALQILFVNLVMNDPPAMSFGVDPVSTEAMTKPPPPAPPVNVSSAGSDSSRSRLQAPVMALGTLDVLHWARGPAPRLALPTTAGTTAFVALVSFQIFNLLNVRHGTRSVIHRDPLHNRSVFVDTAVVAVLIMLVVEMNVLHGSSPPPPT